MVFARRRGGAARALAALVILLGSTEAQAHQHPVAPDAHVHAAAPQHVHGHDCDHSRTASPIDEQPRHDPDRAECTVCWAGAVGGKALAAPPVLATLSVTKRAAGSGTEAAAPGLKKIRVAFEARGPPASIGA